MGKLGLIEGGGQTNYLSLKAGDKKRIRILLDKDHKIQASWWHSIPENDSLGRSYHEWLCPGQRLCVLCEKNLFSEKASETGKLDNQDKPFPIKKKYMVNCWSYAEECLKVFSFGGRILDQLRAQEDGSGKNIDQFDIVITRTGSNRNDTVYGVVSVPDDKNTIDPLTKTPQDLKAILAESAKSDEELDEVLSGAFDAKFKKNGEAALEAPGEQPLEIEAPKPRRTFFLRGNIKPYVNTLTAMGWVCLNDHMELQDSHETVDWSWEPLKTLQQIKKTEPNLKLTAKELEANLGDN
jgi:hypothetical protein